MTYFLRGRKDPSEGKKIPGCLDQRNMEMQSQRAATSEGQNWDKSRQISSAKIQEATKIQR